MVCAPLLTKEGQGVIGLTMRKVSELELDLTTFKKLSNLCSIRFARLGDVLGIIGYTEELANTDDALANFARYLQQLTKQYDFAEICKILEQ